MRAYSCWCQLLVSAHCRLAPVLFPRSKWLHVACLVASQSKVWLQVREWLPDELRDQSSGNRNRVQVELKGSTVVSYVYQTAMVCTPGPLAALCTRLFVLYKAFLVLLPL